MKDFWGLSFLSIFVGAIADSCEHPQGRFFMLKNRRVSALAAARHCLPLNKSVGVFRGRTKSGATLVEAASAMAVLLPILILLILVVTQVGQYFVLKQQLAYVARQAARETAYAYGRQGLTSMNQGGTSSGIANVADANYQQILNRISVPSVINANSSTQFRVYFNIPNSPSLTKSYVTAVATYRSGPNLPVFPWNPLQSGLLRFDGSSIVVNSSCSWPIPHS